MRRTLCLLALLSLTLALPARGQGVIEAGQTVEGELADDDPEGASGALYDLWSFTARAGATYVITLRSDDFDAYLWAGPAVGPHCDPCEEDDDGAGGTDAELVVTAEADRPYVIRATSYDAGESGRYLLTVQESAESDAEGLPEGEPEPLAVDTSTITRDGPALVPGTPANGVLEDGDLQSEGAYYDVWLYEGRAGERLTVSLRSRDFDAVLRVGHWVRGRWRELGSDDDGGRGTDSELAVILPADTRYEVHASAFAAGEAGGYALEAASMRDAAEVVTVPSGADLPFLLPGATRDEALREDDYPDENGGVFDAYTYLASAGETATVELASSDFDGVLRIGTREGGDWRELDRAAADGGTRARLTRTFPERGEYEIRVGSARAGQTGAYALYSESSIHAESAGMVPPGMVAVGQTVRGRLDEADERAEDGAFVDGWDLGGGGSTVTIDLRSDDFDPLLRVLVQTEDGGWREIAADDDGGVGTDSRLTIDLPHPGRFRVEATTVRPGDRGEYLLSVRFGPP